MRWTKNEKKLIQRQIEEYDKKMNNTKHRRKCAFCRKGDPICSKCPNLKICKILKIHHSRFISCYDNYYYLVDKFNLSQKVQFKDFTENMEQVEFRRKMWQDALDMCKKDFVKKYKKEGK